VLSPNQYKYIGLVMTLNIKRQMLTYYVEQAGKESTHLSDVGGNITRVKKEIEDAERELVALKWLMANKKERIPERNGNDWS